MAKYKIVRYAWRHRRFACGRWRDVAGGAEIAPLVWPPNGRARLSRTGDRRTAGVTFTAHGKTQHIEIFPAPTRAGLVRMACREIRKIVKESTPGEAGTAGGPTTIGTIDRVIKRRGTRKKK